METVRRSLSLEFPMIKPPADWPERARTGGTISIAVLPAAPADIPYLLILKLPQRGEGMALKRLFE